ncbi:hypothetical protein Dimus_022925, partial [Dionaea muscipula]
AQLMYAIWENKPVNWALYVFHRIADQVNKEAKARLIVEEPPKGIFHIKKTFGIIVSHLLSLMGVQLKETIVVHPSKRLFGKVEDTKKRKTSTSPVVEKKEKKRVRKLVMSSPSVASSTGPAKGNSAEEVRSSIGEAPQGEQAKDMAQDPPQDAQDPIGDVNIDVVGIGKAAAADAHAEETSGERRMKAVEDDPIIIDDPINIDKEIQRFNAWLSWKLSRSRTQADNIERMHAEEDWVMGMVDCYELFESVDAESRLIFSKLVQLLKEDLQSKGGRDLMGKDQKEETMMMMMTMINKEATTLTYPNLQLNPNLKTDHQPSHSHNLKPSLRINHQLKHKPLHHQMNPKPTKNHKLRRSTNLRKLMMMWKERRTQMKSPKMMSLQGHLGEMTRMRRKSFMIQ